MIQELINADRVFAEDVALSNSKDYHHRVRGSETRLESLFLGSAVLLTGAGYFGAKPEATKLRPLPVGVSHSPARPLFHLLLAWTAINDGFPWSRMRMWTR